MVMQLSQQSRSGSSAFLVWKFGQLDAIENSAVGKLPFEKSLVEELPVGKLPFEKFPVEKLPVEKLPVKELPFEKLPFEKLPFEKLPAEGCLLRSYLFRNCHNLQKELLERWIRVYQ